VSFLDGGATVQLKLDSSSGKNIFQINLFWTTSMLEAFCTRLLLQFRKKTISDSFVTKLRF
jgi:hypothetical protein